MRPCSEGAAVFRPDRAEDIDLSGHPGSSAPAFLVRYVRLGHVDAVLRLRSAVAQARQFGLPPVIECGDGRRSPRRRRQRRALCRSPCPKVKPFASRRQRPSRPRCHSSLAGRISLGAPASEGANAPVRICAAPLLPWQPAREGLPQWCCPRWGILRRSVERLCKALCALKCDGFSAISSGTVEPSLKPKRPPRLLVSVVDDRIAAASSASPA